MLRGTLLRLLAVQAFEDSAELYEEENKKRHYGTIRDPELQGVGKEKAFRKALWQYSAPSILLFYTWLIYVPILAPLIYMSYINLTSGHYLMECGRQDGWKEILCAITRPGVTAFPTVCRMTSLGVLSWRMVRQRLYYVLLENRILIDFHRYVGLDAAVLLIQILFFLLAFFHFVVFCFYGYARDRQGDLIEDEHMMSMTLSELLRDPHMLHKREHHHFYRFLVRVGRDYLAPALAAILFTFLNEDMGEQLITVPKLYDRTQFDPQYVSLHLAESISVLEEVACELLSCDEDGNAESEISDRCDERQTAKQRATLINASSDLDSAIQIFREEALAYDTTIAARNDNRESRYGSEHLQPMGVCEMLTTRWWPLQLLVKDDRSGRMQFSKYWGIHNAMFCVLIGMEIAIRIDYIKYNVDSLLQHSESHAQFVCFMIVSCAILIFLLLVLWISARHTYLYLLR